MLGKLFGKKEKKTEEIFLSPMNGKIVEIESVPDPTFSEKMMGDGIAVEPVDGKVLSPIDGEIMQVFPTGHAVGIQGETGIEVLIHVGLETVSMNGEGFEVLVKAGDKVKAGDELLFVNLDLVKEKAASTITPIVITNGNIMKTLDKKLSDSAQAGVTEIMTVKVNE
jgi:sugar PTS system EIIA component